MFKSKKITATLTLAVILLGSFMLVGCQKAVTTVVGAPALLPVSYPAQDNIRISELDDDLLSNMKSFAASSFLALVDDKENYVYSPMSAYIALSILYEGSSDNTKSQIENVLGLPNGESLRAKIKKTYEYNYFCNYGGNTKIANSLWVSSNVNTLDDYTTTLADNYYTEEYKIDFPTQKNCIPKWINYYTDNLFQLNEKDYQISDETLLALINTIYFSNNWTSQFKNEYCHEYIFSNGEKTKAPFMFHFVRSEYAEFDNYCTVSDSFKNNYNITYIVPNEEVEISDLLNTNVLANNNTAITRKDVRVDLGVPEIEYENSYDLKPMLQSFGITDAFNYSMADFSKISSDSLFVNVIKQDIGISFSKKGIQSTSSNFKDVDEADIPDYLDRKMVILNHPFLYVITDGNNLPIIMGIVNNV